MSSDAVRRSAIAADARRRAQVWAEPGEDGNVTPVSRRPHTSDDMLRNAGASRDPASVPGGQPTVVGSSAEFVSRRPRGTGAPSKVAWADPAEAERASFVSLPQQQQQPSSGRRPDRGNAPLSALRYGSTGDQQQPPTAPTPFHCPACTSCFDPPAPQGESRPARLPVLLVPCGHTVCKACIRAWAQRSDADATSPTCPLCQSAFSGTAINQALALALPAAIARDAAAAQSSADVVAGATATAASHIAPLPPMLRRAITAYAVDETHGMQAEQSARVALSHARLAQLRREEARLAVAEHEDAVATSRSQGTVYGALSVELGNIEAEIKRLEVERAVVLTQLGDVLQKKAGCSVREYECDVRRVSLTAVAAIHAANAEQQRNFVMQLVPSDDVRVQLDNGVLAGGGAGAGGQASIP